MQIIKRNFHYIVIAFGVVLVWRGIWGLADIYLFPENQQLSLIASVILGVAILLLIDPKSKDVKELI